jgi:hypothetical protein
MEPVAGGSGNVVPVREDLFSRMRGLLESDVVADKCVFTAAWAPVGRPLFWSGQTGIMNQS